MTTDSLIDLLSNFNNNKPENVKINVLDWISELEVTRQRHAMGHHISDGHFIMHALANLPREYAIMSTQLYATLSKGTLTIQETWKQLMMH